MGNHDEKDRPFSWLQSVMKHYRLRLFPESPLALENDHVIPASVLRGAIATIALSGCNPAHSHDVGPCKADCRYWSLFGTGAGLRISAAYAGSDDDTLPFLASARTCSAHPGFKSTEGHGVFDVAIRAWLFERAAPTRLYAPPFMLRCTICGAALMPCEGWYTRHADDDYSLIADSISTPVHTGHAALSRRRKRIVAQYSADGLIINRNIYYIARVAVPDQIDALLRDMIAGGVWIGARRSRGMGAMRTELLPLPTDGLTMPLNERIARFNRIVRGEERFYTAMDNTTQFDDGDWYFTLDLHDTALTSPDFAPSIVPPLPGISSAVPVRQWLSPRTVSGWHIAAGLPRRTQIGVSGVILYRVPADMNRSEVELALSQIERDGIGVARERGYGFATICDPFHLLVEPV